jgi:hypothetical protein
MVELSLGQLPGSLKEAIVELESDEVIWHVILKLVDMLIGEKVHDSFPLQCYWLPALPHPDRADA